MHGKVVTYIFIRLIVYVAQVTVANRRILMFVTERVYLFDEHEHVLDLVTQ